MPFALPSLVRIHGREEVRRNFARNGQAGLSLQADAVRAHGRPRSGDRRVRLRRARREWPVLRVRDGRIVETRDYHNHAALAAVLT
jgi:hypothetical protein